MPKKLTYNYVKQQIEKSKYKLLSREYKNKRSKIKIECDKGHEYSVTWNDFQQGCRCPVCDPSQKLTYNYVKEQIERDGYKLLSKIYKNNHSKLSIKCDKGHEYTSIWNSFQQGRRCPICNIESKSSKAEKEIQEYVKTITENVICNNRNMILNPNTGFYLELDVYLPDLNKAIEYNGIYWHSLSNTIKHDKIKQEECERLGIKLLTITDECYIVDKELELQKIYEWIKGDV